MNAPQMLQRMRMRSQLLLKPHSSMGIRRQPSVQSYRSENNSSSHSVSNKSFRPRFERILQEKKLHLMLDTQHSDKVHYNSTTKASQIQKQVTKSKKSLNDLIVQRKSLDKNCKRLKFQIEKLKNQREAVNESQMASQTDVKYLIKRDNKLSHIQEQSYNSMLCYEEMRLRNQQQTILWKARYQQLTRYYKQYQHNIRQLILQQSSLIQTQSEIYLSLQATKNIVEKAESSKQQVLILHKQQIEDKRQIDRWKSQRGKQKEQFQQLAGVQQQKQQVKQYREYYLANKFLLRMMKSKGERIMERYRYQHAGFEHIRQNTGLSNTNIILQRMQVQDQLYEQKLQQITDLENQLKLIKDNQDIKDKYLQTNESVRSSGFKQRQLDDKLERLRVLKQQKVEEIQEITKFQALLKNWINKSNIKLNLPEEPQKQSKDTIGRILDRLQNQDGEVD